MDSVISTGIMARTFECLEKGKPVADASGHKSLLYSIACFFRSLLECCDVIAAEIEEERAVLESSKNDICLPLLRGKLGADGHLPVGQIIQFEVNGSNFALEEINSTLRIDHYDPHAGNDDEVNLENMLISDLKLATLKAHLRDQRAKGEPADLSEFDFTGLNLSDVDFNGAVITVKNLTQIVTGDRKLRGKLNGAQFHAGTVLNLEQLNQYLGAGGSDLRGARFVDQENDARNMVLPNAAIGLPMALSLIEARADPTQVLIRYLQTKKIEAESNSRVSIDKWLVRRPHKTVADLGQNKIDRIQREKMKDYSWIDLRDFPLQRIDTSKISEAGLALEYAIGISNATPLGRLRNLARRKAVPLKIQEVLEFGEDLDRLHAQGMTLKPKIFGAYNAQFSIESSMSREELVKSMNSNYEIFFMEILMALNPRVTPDLILNDKDVVINELMQLLPCSLKGKGVLKTFLTGTGPMPHGYCLKDFLTPA